MNGYATDSTFTCPSFIVQPPIAATPRCNLPFGMNEYASYLRQIVGGPSPQGLPGYSGLFDKYHSVRLEEVNAASQSIFHERPRGWRPTLTTPTVAGLIWNATYAGTNFDWCANPGTTPAPFLWFHVDGINIARFDGGVSFVSQADCLNSRNNNTPFIAQVAPGPSGAGVTWFQDSF